MDAHMIPSHKHLASNASVCASHAHIFGSTVYTEQFPDELHQE